LESVATAAEEALLLLEEEALAVTLLEEAGTWSLAMGRRVARWELKLKGQALGQMPVVEAVLVLLYPGRVVPRRAVGGECWLCSRCRRHPSGRLARLLGRLAAAVVVLLRARCASGWIRWGLCLRGWP
jgi:hypothetical protein